MLSHEKFKEAFAGLTSVAQKVYLAAPISEPWSVKQIHSQLLREGHSIDVRTVEGCIHSLHATGLIANKDRKGFARSPVKPPRNQPAQKEIVPPQQEEVADVPKPEEKQVTTSLQQSATSKLERLVDQARALAEQAKRIASELETAAIEVTEQLHRNDEETKSLNQLKQLLKSLN